MGASQTSRTDSEDALTNTTVRPLLNVEVRIPHPGDLTIVPLGTDGEIQVRGYQTMLEYFDDPVSTGQMITPDRWLRTGDLGTMDESGYVRVYA